MSHPQWWTVKYSILSFLLHHENSFIISLRHDSFIRADSFQWICWIGSQSARSDSFVIVADLVSTHWFNHLVKMSRLYFRKLTFYITKHNILFTLHFIYHSLFFWTEEITTLSCDSDDFNEPVESVRKSHWKMNHESDWSDHCCSWQSTHWFNDPVKI